MTAIKKAKVSMHKEDILEAIADYIEKQLGGKDRCARPSKYQIVLQINTVQTIPTNALTVIEFDSTNLFVDAEVSLL